MKPGDTGYLDLLTPRYKRTTRYIPVVISKVGRKYFYVEATDDSYIRPDVKFSIETKKQVTDYTMEYRFHDSLENLLETEQKMKILKELKDLLIYGFNINNASLQDMQEALKLLSKKPADSNKKQ